VECDDTGIGRIMTNRRLPVVGVRNSARDEQMTQDKIRIEALSKGVPRDIAVAQDRKNNIGMTVDEFKKVLHKRMGRSQ
jgi:hypothetical protein